MVMLQLKIALFAISITQTFQELVWEEYKPTSPARSAPQPRRNAAIGYDADENSVYIFGGMTKDNEQPLNDFYSFKMTTKEWTPLTRPSKVEPRFSTVFGSRKNHMYIAMGEGIDSSSSGRKYFDDLFRYDFRLQTWEELKSGSSLKPKHRYAAAGGIHEDDSTFFISHGFGDDESFSDSFSYDTNPASGWERVFAGTNSYDPRYPHARVQHSSTMISQNKLVLFGGCLSGQGTGGPCPSDDSWTFDKSSKKWTELNRCASPKLSSAMAALPRRNTSTKVRVVLWGGNPNSRTTLASDDDEMEEVAVLIPEKDEWVLKKAKALGNKFPTPREGHVMVTTSQGIVMFGGKQLSDGSFLSDIWLLRGTSDDADSSLDGRECGRQYFNLIMLHGIFMFIGWSVFLIMGIFAARYFSFLQPLWYRIHLSFQIIGVVFVLAGTICGIVSVPAHQHFKFAHSIFGYIIFVMVVQQPFNAMLRPQPTEQGYNCGRSFWEIWHRSSGMLTVLASFINITLGLFLAVAPTLVWALWLAYLGLWIILFIVAEVVKRPFEKSLKRKARKPVVYDTSNPYRISKGQVNTAF